MDDVLTLIAETVTGYDENGNEIITQTRRDVFCQIYGVTRSEFYAAATVEMRPDVTARLSDVIDYNGEKLASLHGELYDIIRTYRDSGSFRGGSGLDPNGIELILQHRIGNQEDE